jgi:SAM-dependent methyltransferase
MTSNDYAYRVGDPYSLEGIRQLVKFWHVQRLVDMCPYPPRILDVGCGYADIFRFLKVNNAEVHYDGVDLVPRENFGIKPMRFDAERQRLTDIIPNMTKYDLILMLDFLQNVDTETGLKTIMDAYIKLGNKRGGVLTISVRNSLVEAETDKDHHVSRWEIDKLTDYLKVLGFEIGGVWGINWGMNEGELRDDGSQQYYFLPRRVQRTMHKMDDWRHCKFVVIDAYKRGKNEL